MDHRIKRKVASGDKYYPMPNVTTQNRELTFEARGMLAYIMSRPPDWEVKAHDLQQQCGRNRVYRILNELIKAGYIVRSTIKNDKGKITEWVYEVTDIANPLPQNQEVENQEVENGHTTNNRVVQNTENLSIPPAGGKAESQPMNPNPSKDNTPALHLCPHCNQQVAIAVVIGQDGTHTRVCPACKTAIEVQPEQTAAPEPTHRQTVNAHGRLSVLVVPDWFDKQHAAVIKAGLEGTTIRGNRALTGWDNTCAQLSDDGYLQVCGVYRWRLTEKGRALKAHPLVKALQQAAAETHEREAAKPKRVKAAKKPKEAPVELHHELQVIADALADARYHVRFRDVLNGARWGIMRAAEKFFEDGLTPDDVRLVQEYFIAQDWLTCNPHTYYEKVQDARTWKAERHASAPALRFAEYVEPGE